MARVKINKQKCKACYLCVAFCPLGLIKKSKQLSHLGHPIVEFVVGEKKCSGCTFCAIVCPDAAIEVEE